MEEQKKKKTVGCSGSVNSVAAARLNEESNEGPNVLFGLRHGGGPIYAGSKPYPCFRCSSDTMIAPSGQDLLAKDTSFKVCCLPCITKEELAMSMGGGTVHVPAGAVSEIENALRAGI